MSLLFCDSFDHYAAGDALLKYAGSGSFNSMQAGRLGGYCARLKEYCGTFYVNFSPVATVIAGFAIRMNSSAATWSNKLPILWVGDAYGEQVHFVVTGTSRIEAWRLGGTTLGISSWAMPVDTWVYLEFKTTIDASAGSIEVRANGVPILSLSGINTKGSTSSYASTTYIGNWGGNGSATVDYDDLYVCDTNGSYNTDFLGDVHISALLPTANGTYAQFTPSAGSNYQNVDDPTPSGDVDYNSDSTVGHKDTFVMADLPSVSGSIHGVQTLIYARKTDAGTRSICDTQRSGSTDTDGSSIPLMTTYRYGIEVHETNPATGIPYTPSEVNALEVGYRISA